MFRPGVPEIRRIMATVNVSLGIKASLGNYNMANINYSLTDEIREGETEQEAKERIEAIVDGWVGEKLAEIKAKNGA